MGCFDGYQKVVDIYGVDFIIIILNNVLMYKVVYESEVDVISGYVIDGWVEVFCFWQLEDDCYVFFFYYCVLIMQKKLVEENKNLMEVFGLFEGWIDDFVMMVLNYWVDFDKILFEQVVWDFLKVEGFWWVD